MKIVVCDDQAIYQAAISEAIQHWKSVTGHHDIDLSFFSSSEDLLDYLKQNGDIDLVFIDIQLPGDINGIDLARSIRNKHYDITIVFCTNYSEYVFDGYTVNALRYLKKPVSQEDINFCCSYVYNRIALKSDHSITVYSSGKRYAFRHVEIRSIEVRARNLYFSTTLSTIPICIKATLTEIQNHLPKDLFVLCHRSYIVNISHVRMITRNSCVMSDSSIVPISRTYANHIAQAFDRYHQGGRIVDDLDSI